MDYNKNTLIINFLDDDDRGDIAGLTAAIQKKRRAEGEKLRVVDFKDFASVGKEKFDEVCLVSHHRFFDKNMVPIKIEDRRMGGHELDEVADVVSGCVFDNKVKNVQFYGCEMATSVDAHKRDDRDPLMRAKPLVQIPFKNGAAAGAEQHLKRNNAGSVSTLAYFSSKLYNKMRQKKFGEEVRLRGINGVGFMRKEDVTPRGFDQENLADLHKFETLEFEGKKEKNRAKLRRAEELEERFVDRHVVHKKSAHQLEFALKL